MTSDYQVELPSGEPVVYYRFGGRAVAWRNSTLLRYLLADHLGSTQAEVSESQGEVGQRRYYVFGTERPEGAFGSLSRDERFTGQRRLGSGDLNPLAELYHYGARFYLPGVGIFSQPDTVVPEPQNPQALNRYSYVLNNPLKYADAQGRFPWLVVGGALVGAGIGYSIQVHGNLQKGMGLGTALTTDIRAEPILLGAAIGATAVLAAPAAVAAVGEGLMGIGVATGSTAAFAAGTRAIGASEAVAEAITGVASLAQMTTRLQRYTDIAVENVDSRGPMAFTGPQQEAATRRPGLSPAYRGTAIHNEFSELVGSDRSLSRLQLAEPFTRAPDVIDPVTQRWWDVTTPKQWDLHANKYVQEFGPDGWPLVYE